MPPRRRRVLLALFIAAAMLCAGLATLWAVNLSTGFYAWQRTAAAGRTLALTDGGLWCSMLSPPPPGIDRSSGFITFDHPYGRGVFSSGVSWLPLWSSTPGQFYCNIPLWLIMAPTLVAAILLARALLRKRTHCACGYSATGLPATAPCPECGRPRARAAT